MINRKNPQYGEYAFYILVSLLLFGVLLLVLS
jgi:hypothetical protein